MTTIRIGRRRTSWRVVGLHPYGHLVTKIAFLDGTGDPFAESLSVAGGDLGGGHGDQVVATTAAACQARLAAASRRGRWTKPQPFLASLTLSSMCALAAPAFDLGRVPGPVGEQEAAD